MIRIGMLAVLMLIAVLAGCKKEAQTDTKQLPRSARETRKAELLSAIDARYENPEAHYQLAKLYHQDGAMERAEFHYNVAMGFDPMHRRAQAAMVRLIKDRQDTQRAQITADLYINQASASSDSLMALGRNFQQEGLNNYALVCYQRAQSMDPNSAPIYKQLGYYYLAAGDKVQAEGYFRRSFDIDPNQPDVAAELGRMGVQVVVPARKATGLLGPLKDAVTGEPEDETVK